MRLDRHLDYHFDVQDQGGDPSGVSDSTAAFIVSCFQASSQPLGATVIAVGRFKTNNTIPVPNGVKLDLTSAVIVPTADVNLFQIKPGGRIVGGKIDTSTITFTHACFYFAGTDKFYFDTRTGRSGVKDAVCIGGTGVGKGAVIFLDSEDATSGFVVGVSIEGIRSYGFTYAIRLYRSGSIGTNYNNGNIFRDVWAMNPVYFIHLDNAIASADDNNGNQFFGCQLEWGADTLRALYCNGTTNQFHLFVWDIAGATAIEFTANSHGNYLVWQAPNPTLISDSGTRNIITSTDSGTFKAAALNVKTKAGTPTDADFLNPVDGLVVVDTTANKIWTRIGGVWKGVVVA